MSDPHFVIAERLAFGLNVLRMRNNTKEVGTNVDVVWRSFSATKYRLQSVNTMATKEQALILDPAGELHFKGT